MIRFLVSKPVGVLISFFALLLLGFTAYLYLPTSLLPNTGVPRMVVKIDGPNYSAREIEQSLIAPIRSNLSQLHGLSHLESTASEGKGTIDLVFEHGINTSMAFVEINEKVDMAMNRLPKDTQRPLVSQSDIGDIPVFNLNIIADSEGISDNRLIEMGNFVKGIICRRIEQLPEVSMVDITGYAQAEIQLVPKEGYLQSLGLDNHLLIQAFQENKVNLGNIMVKDGHYQYYLKFTTEVQTLSAIENIPLNIQGRLFKLSDLVTVDYLNTSPKGSFFSNSKKAINLTVIKQSGTKMDDLKKSFKILLDHFSTDYPDFRFEISQDQTNLLDFSINNLQQDLLLGGVLAFLLMLIFIRKIRSAVLIGITIPLTLAISQLGFYLAGLSLNIISLGGLILGLGMIIDNSIVVIDNINRYRKEGLDVTEACIQGTNEIIKPIITSVLTNCAVFVPLIFLSGLAGAIFYDQAISIVIGIITSLLVSIILLPPLYKLIYSGKASTTREFEIKSYIQVTSWYESILKKVFKYPIVTSILVCCLFLTSLILFNNLNKERVPPITRYDSYIYIDWNENIDIGENENRINGLIKELGEDVIEANSWIGEQQFILPQENEQAYTQASIYIRVKDSDYLNTVLKQLNNLCNKKYPKAILKISPAKNAFESLFANELAPLKLNVSSANNRTMPKIEQTNQLIDSLKTLFPKLNINSIALYDKIVLKVNTQQAALHQISITTISNQLKDHLKPILIDNFQDAQVLVPIVLIGRPYSSVNEMLSQTFIKTPNNIEIPLSYLVEITKEKEYKYITASAQGEYYPIDLNTTQANKDLSKIENLINHAFKNMLSVEYKGSYFENIDLVNEMSFILLVSVLLLYFILSAQFESLIQPLFILIELPIALSGAFIFIYIANNSLNLMSMIGIVIMGGLIINDSILKIDAINQLRKQGMPLMEAIFEGGHKRLKPIIMISLTSIGSLLPTLFMNDLGSELQKPLALALIGGMFIGMFVSLFFVPLLYWFVYKNKRKP